MTRNPPAAPPGLLDELRQIVGAAHVIDDPERLGAYTADWTGRFVGCTPAVVRPGTTEEVAQVVRRCRVAGTAIVPQGGNTGLVGGGVPLQGEVVLSTTRMDQVTMPVAGGGHLVAGAGATLAQVADAARSAGRAYPVDFGARDVATVGGMVATNAGGVHVLRWGGTRRQVLGVEAVLGDGSVVSHLDGLIKDNTGYDLAGLLCGSEGTLAIVTAACLRLVPRPAGRAVALLGMGDVGAAVAAVGALEATVSSLSAAELVVGPCLDQVVDGLGLAPPTARAPAYLVLEALGASDPTEELGEAVAALGGIVDVAVGIDTAGQDRLWRYREAVPEALALLGEVVKLDVSVPRGAIEQLCASVGPVVAAVAPRATTWVYGHVGDGNLHVNVTGVEDDIAVEDAVLRHVVGLGGSISAEHGIGTAKRRWLGLNRSAAEIAAFRALKQALDPDGILNPGVLLPG